MRLYGADLTPAHRHVQDLVDALRGIDNTAAALTGTVGAVCGGGGASGSPVELVFQVGMELVWPGHVSVA